MPRSRSFVIRRADQLSALASPVRFAIVESLSVHGPGTARELAARLDRAPESLYYHLRQLVSVGLLVLKEKRTTRRRGEAVYALVAPKLVLDPTQRSRPFRDALARSAAVLLRLGARNVRAAIERGDAVHEGSGQNLVARRQTARLTRQGLKRVHALLDEIGRLLEELDDPEKGEPHALTTLLVPLPERDV